MARKLQHYPWRARRGLLGVAVLVLTLGVWLGVAGAANQPPVTVDIQQGNTDCGNDDALPVIGKVTFSRNDNRLTTTVNFTHADSHSTYVETLYDGDTCDAIKKLGKITTNNAGKKKATFTTQVPGHQSFFVYSYNGDGNDSLIANLPR